MIYRLLKYVREVSHYLHLYEVVNPVYKWLRYALRSTTQTPQMLETVFYTGNPTLFHPPTNPLFSLVSREHTCSPSPHPTASLLALHKLRLILRRPRNTLLTTSMPTRSLTPRKPLHHALLIRTATPHRRQRHAAPRLARLAELTDRNRRGVELEMAAPASVIALTKRMNKGDALNHNSQPNHNPAQITRHADAAG